MTPNMRKLVYFLSLVVLVVGYSNKVKENVFPNCPGGFTVCDDHYFYVPESNLCFSKISPRATWENAWADCRSQSANLPVIKSDAEEFSLETFATGRLSLPAVVWLGLRYVTRSKLGTWVDGSNFDLREDYHAFNPDRKNSGASRVSYIAVDTAKNAWIFRGRQEKHSYTCVKQPDASKLSSICPDLISLRNENSVFNIRNGGFVDFTCRAVLGPYGVMKFIIVYGNFTEFLDATDRRVSKYEELVQGGAENSSCSRLGHLSVRLNAAHDARLTDLWRVGCWLDLVENIRICSFYHGRSEHWKFLDFLGNRTGRRGPRGVSLIWLPWYIKHKLEIAVIFTASLIFLSLAMAASKWRALRGYSRL